MDISNKYLFFIGGLIRATKVRLFFSLEGGGKGKGEREKEEAWVQLWRKVSRIGELWVMESIYKCLCDVKNK